MTTEPTDPTAPMARDPEDDFDPAAGPGYDPSEELFSVAWESAINQFQRADSLVKKLATIVLQDDNLRGTLSPDLFRDLIQYISQSYVLTDQLKAIESYAGETEETEEGE